MARIHFGVAVVCMLLAVPHLIGGEVPTVENVLERMKQSRQELRSLRVIVESEVRRTPKNDHPEIKIPLMVRTSDQLLQHGDFVRMSRTEHRRIAKAADDTASSFKVVINSEFTFFWAEAQPIARGHDHEAANERPHRAVVLSGGIGAKDAMLSAYGSGNMSLWDLHRKFSKDGWRWTIENHGVDQGAFKVSLLKEDLLWSTFIVDSEKNYCVTERKAYWPNGTIRSDRTVSYEKINGTWVPVHVVETERAADTRAVVREEEIRFVNWEINPVIDETEFTVAALVIADDTRVIRTDRNEERRTWRVLNGEMRLP